ncbi:hypothetical protein ACN4EG_19175 [Alkalinema pantanalense CENA528]|uniref:hypothetical protein n=1 Tax=Alkalinema pantanalense TaxID=1620705 RepID=UPI003D6F39C4
MTDSTQLTAIQPTATQPITIQPTTPQIPTPDTQIPIDPSNPLCWLLVLATLLTATEKPLNAIANLLKILSPLLPKQPKKNPKSKRK